MRHLLVESFHISPIISEQIAHNWFSSLITETFGRNEVTPRFIGKILPILKKSYWSNNYLNNNTNYIFQSTCEINNLDLGDTAPFLAPFNFIVNVFVSRQQNFDIMKVSKGETSFGTYKNPGTWKRNTTKSDKAKQQNGYIEGASITIDIILPRNAKPARDYVPPFKSLLTHEIQHLFLYYAVNKRSYKLSTTPLVNKKGKTLYFDQNKLPIKSYLSAGQYLESFKKAQDDYKKLYQNSGLNYNDLQKYKIYYDQAMFLYSIMYNIDEDEMKSFVAQVATEASQIPNLTYQNYKEYLPKFTAYNKIKKIEEFYNQIINLQKVADGESNDETKNKNAKPSKKSQDDAQYQLDAISSILKQYGNYKGETTYDNIDQLLQNIQTAQTNLDNNFYSSLYKWLVAKKRVNTNSKPYWTIPGYKSSDSSFKI